ncbi:TolC family protein [Fusobacterium sp.]|uniref:TolC family protein n=1 Tax=Fusobacterium sp. TaxID=68766 RepID=UPI002616A9CD|nr:TolC family protein [Fusobacterium sp.]
MRKKLLVVFFSFLLLSCSNNQITPEEKVTNLQGKEYLKQFGSSISLEEAIKIARERNLDLKTKRLEREIASLDKKIAFGNFLPSINILGGYTKLDNQVDIGMETSSLTNNLPFPLPPIVSHLIPSTLSTRFIDESFYTYGIGAQIPVFVPSTWFLYSARKKGEKISELAESLTDKMIQLQIMGEYFYILALQSEEEYLTNQLSSAKEIEKKAKISLKVDAILPWEVEKAKTLVKSREIALENNRRDLKIAKMNIMKSLNLNPLDDIVLEDINLSEKNLPELEECIYIALSQNEMLQILDTSKNISKDIKKIAISNFLPKIILGGGYVKNNNDIFVDSSVAFGNISGVISIFNGFKNINEYKKAARREKISELKLEKEFLTIIIETTRAYENVKKSKEICEMAELNYKAETGKIKQRSAEKNVGLIGDDEYYLSLASYQEALSLKKKADFQYQIALGALSIAMGQNPFIEGGK